jgi:hypothetical protein
MCLCSILRDDLPVAHPDLVRFVHPDTGVGIAAALAVAAQPSGRTWEQHFQRATVTADERRLLRCVLSWLFSSYGSVLNVLGSGLCAYVSDNSSAFTKSAPVHVTPE